MNKIIVNKKKDIIYVGERDSPRVNTFKSSIGGEKTTLYSTNQGVFEEKSMFSAFRRVKKYLLKRSGKDGEAINTSIPQFLGYVEFMEEKIKTLERELKKRKL